MKKYNIYRYADGEKIAEITATSVIAAEIKFLKTTEEYGSNEIYALSAE